MLRRLKRRKHELASKGNLVTDRRNAPTAPPSTTTCRSGEATRQAAIDANSLKTTHVSAKQPLTSAHETDMTTVRLAERFGALFMPALVALQRSPQVKAYFERLVARGKPKMKAVVAVMRKLLHAIWGMIRYQSVWDGERFCATVEVAEAVASRLPEPPAERRLPIAHASAEPARADAGKGARGSGGADQPQRRGQRATRPLPGSSTVAC
ncbi:MAG: hypothetical protein RIT45_202 [Pseudomonadota bacterium]